MSDQDFSTVNPTSVSTTGFDYSTLPAETAQTLRNAVSAIRGIQHAAISDVGRHLIDAKEKLLEHGQFLAWAEAELGISSRSAQRYMRAAQFLDGKHDTVSHLPHGILYKLSAPSAPEDVVQQVVAAAEAGTPLPASEIDARLAAASQHELEIKRTIEASRFRKPLTREKAAEKLARRQVQLQREYDQQQREDELRYARVQPLVDKVRAALGPELLVAVQKVLTGTDDWRDRQPFLRLIAEPAPVLEPAVALGGGAP
jgi:Protein of unknown function (DUF3102)